MDKIVGKLWYFLISVFIIFDDVPDTLTSLPKLKVSKKGKKIKNKIFSTITFFWLSIAGIATFSFYYFMAKQSVFIVSANVEQLSISPYKNKVDPDLQNQNYPEWKFNNAALYEDCSSDVEKIHKNINGMLYLNANTYIEFVRIQKNELTINLDNETTDTTGTFVPNKGDPILLSDCTTISLVIKENDSYVFPIEGEIKLGGYIKEGADSVPILYDGEITVIDKAFVSRIYYSVGPFSLNMGDIFTVDNLDQKSSGFVQIDDDKGIKVTYSSKGRKGFITKYRTESIEIKNGFWSKLYNDQSLIILWFIGLLLFAICKAVIRISLTDIEILRKNQRD